MRTIIKGGAVTDLRGIIRFVNDFDMGLIKRFYIIENATLDIVRGWRGHAIEQRWFYAVAGAFRLDIVKPDDWSAPSQHLPVDSLTLTSQESEVLHVPSGYCTAIQSIQPESQLLVFSDYGIDNAKRDDFTWDLDYFVNRAKKTSL